MKKDYTKKQEEFKDQVLEIRRVTRVTKGGKRMRFRTVVVVGNMKGKVGVGVAKGSDVVESIAKAKYQANKNIISVNLKDNTIPYLVEAKYSSAKLIAKPAESGHGLMAGGSARVIFKIAGIHDITAKYTSSTKNKLTNAMVALKALKEFEVTEEEEKEKRKSAEKNKEKVISHKS